MRSELKVISLAEPGPGTPIPIRRPAIPSVRAALAGYAPSAHLLALCDPLNPILGVGAAGITQRSQGNQKALLHRGLLSAPSLRHVSPVRVTQN